MGKSHAAPYPYNTETPIEYSVGAKLVLTLNFSGILVIQGTCP